jgi:hypothetical protein
MPGNTASSPLGVERPLFRWMRLRAEASRNVARGFLRCPDAVAPWLAAASATSTNAIASRRHRRGRATVAGHDRAPRQSGSPRRARSLGSDAASKTWALAAGGSDCEECRASASRSCAGMVTETDTAARVRSFVCGSFMTTALTAVSPMTCPLLHRQVDRLLIRTAAGQAGIGNVVVHRLLTVRHPSPVIPGGRVRNRRSAANRERPRTFGAAWSRRRPGCRPAGHSGGRLTGRNAHTASHPTPRPSPGVPRQS